MLIVELDESKMLEKFNKALVPQNCTWEITHKCNFNCIHCYNRQDQVTELGLGESCKIAKDLRDAGVIDVAVSGGEPLLYPKLFDLLALMHSIGLRTTLFSNGTLIGKKEAEFIAKSNVREVEITLYGVSNEVYRLITGSGRGIDDVLIGINNLRLAGVPYSIKAVALKQNFEELEAIYKLAKTLSAGVTGNNWADFADPRIFGSHDKLEHIRLDNDQLIRLYTQRTNPLKDGRATVACAIGRSTFGLLPNGAVLPCTGWVNDPIGNLSETQLSELWKCENASYLRNISWNSLECNECNYFAYCSPCPMAFIVEEGSLFLPSKESCRHAKLKCKCDEVVKNE